jgi:hypothetical protein
MTRASAPASSASTIGAEDRQPSTQHLRDAEDEAGIVERDGDGSDECRSAEHHPHAAQEIALALQHGRMARGAERLGDPPRAHSVNKDGICIEDELHVSLRSADAQNHRR